MDWTRPSGHIIRGFAAVLLFADPKNLRRLGRRMGPLLLQFRAARHHGRQMLHAGHAVARALNHRFVFLPTLGRRVRPRHGTSPSNWRTGLAYKIDIILRERILHLIVDLDQVAEHFDWCASLVRGTSTFPAF